MPAAISLKTELRPCPTLPIAQGTLEQIVLNLVINARDAIEGVGEIRVGCREGPGGAAALWIADTGSGMDEETKTRLFEPFFTTKGPQEGTGLGLSMVQGFVTRTGGWIDVETKLGEGTRFTLRWPPAQARAEAAPAITQTLGEPDDAHVLVVEDNPEAARIMSRTLVGVGYTVTCVSTIGAARDQLGAHAYDLVACDGLLADGSALDLIGALDELPVPPALLVFSGYPEDERVLAAARESGGEVLAKPFSAKQLTRACAELVSPD